MKREKITNILICNVKEKLLLMRVYISHRYLDYEIGNLLRVFFPYKKFEFVKELNGNELITVIQNDNSAEKFVDFRIFLDGNEYNQRVLLDSSDDEYTATAAFYKLLEKISSYTPEWGMLTGIHPVRYYSNFVKQVGEEQANAIFKDEYFVSEKKLKLCEDMFKLQTPYMKIEGEKCYSLYVSIPFCPTRCNYCSFVSQSVQKSKKLIKPYFDLLLKEITYTSLLVKSLGSKLKSVYIGGGTPTTLSATMLKELVSLINNEFDMSYCTEFTLEAGRADTITDEILSAIKSSGVDRISINPQTLNNKVLENIGRQHTGEEVISAYKNAREQGIKYINMDLIAGLMGDSLDSFNDTLNRVIELEPDNITIHALALKRSAKIFDSEDTKIYHGEKDTISSMIESSVNMLVKSGYTPYYMYRQSRMASNAENIGWAKNGSICAYNIYTMDDSHTIIACGAGGVSKVVDPYSNRLERVFNFKYSYEYMDRFDEILKRKEEVINLYAQFCKRVH